MTVLAQDLGTTFQNAVSTGPLFVALLAAALAGLISFASPCCIPLVPGYLSYLAGISGAETQQSPTATRQQSRLAAGG